MIPITVFTHFSVFLLGLIIGHFYNAWGQHPNRKLLKVGSRWCLRGRETQVAEVIIAGIFDEVYIVYDDNKHAVHLPISYFITAAEPIAG